MAGRTPHIQNRRQEPGQRPGPLHTARAYRVADPAIATAAPGSPIPFILSTPGVKRDGLNLATLPFVLDNYRRNPVVLPFHSYLDFPIGRGEIEAIDTPAGQALFALASFDIKDPFGELADRKYRDGFLFAVSIGWDDTDDRGVPVRISKRRAVARDVLEFSVVSVPADTDALIDDGGDGAGGQRSLSRGDAGRQGQELARTRAFLAEARGVLVASDPRADALEDALQRLAACSGEDCAMALEDARQQLGAGGERRVFAVPDAGHTPTTSPAAEPAAARQSTEDLPPESSAPADEAEAEARRRAAMAAMVAELTGKWGGRTAGEGMSPARGVSAGGRGIEKHIRPPHQGFPPEPAHLRGEFPPGACPLARGSGASYSDPLCLEHPQESNVKVHLSLSHPRRLALAGLTAVAAGAFAALAGAPAAQAQQPTPAPTAVPVGGRIQADNACYVRLPDMPPTSLGEGRYGGLGAYNAKTGVLAYAGGADKQTDENPIVFYQMFGIKLDGEKAAWKPIPYSNSVGYTQDTDRGCREGTTVQLSESNWASVFGRDGCDNGRFDTAKKTGGDIKELQVLGDAAASGVKWVPNSGVAELIGDLKDQAGRLIRPFAAWDSQRGRIVFGQGTFNGELDSESQDTLYAAKKVGSQFQLSEMRPSGTAPVRRFGACAAYVYDKDLGLDGVFILGGQQGAPERIPATTYKEVWWLDFKQNASNGAWVNLTGRIENWDDFGARREGACAYDAASKRFYSWMGRTAGAYPDAARRSTGVWRMDLSALADNAAKENAAKLRWERLAKDNTAGLEGRRYIPSIWDAANKRMLVVGGMGGSDELAAFRDTWAIYPDVKGEACANLDVFASHRPAAGATPTPAPATPTPGGPTAEVPTAAPKPTLDNRPEICEAIKARVPAAVINDAVAAPDKVGGYGQACNPNLPTGPGNPLRRYLGLRNPSSPYHPIFNGVVWKCGCP